MKRFFVTSATIVALAGVAAGLSACSAAATAQTPTAVGGAAQAATTIPTATPFSLEQPTGAAGSVGGAIDFGISGVGEVKASRDADLVFGIQGTVASVNVQEGDRVTAGQTLAVLDTRVLDQQVAQAEAALASAQAQETAFTEPPKAADVTAARAALAQAEAQLQSVKAGAKATDRTAAQSGVDAAQVNVQATRDRLSLAKTQAQSQLDQAVSALTSAQARYAQANYNWNFVQETGNDPIVSEVTDPKSGQKVDNKLTEGQRQNYASQFQQAQAALQQAQEGVKLAQAAFDTARQAEVTGIAAAEQQAVQAQTQVDKIAAGADNAQLATAKAGVAQARAALARLQPSQTKAQKAQVSAAIAQATAGLELAKINREKAEIKAPFDGLVSVANVDPGDQSTVTGGPAFKVVNVDNMHLDVQVSDTDIGKVSEGQAAEIRVDALPDKVFTGKITYIAPTATVQGTLRSYLVRLSLDSQQGLRAGMSARVDITPAK